MGQKSDLEKRMSGDRDRIIVEIHDCLQKAKELAERKRMLDSYLGVAHDDPGESITTLTQQPAPSPKRKYIRKANATEDKPPADPPKAGETQVFTGTQSPPLQWQCAHGHKFAEPGKQKIKGAPSLLCCPKDDCHSLDIKRIGD